MFWKLCSWVESATGYPAGGRGRVGPSMGLQPECTSLPRTPAAMPTCGFFPILKVGRASWMWVGRALIEASGLLSFPYPFAFVAV